MTYPIIALDIGGTNINAGKIIDGKVIRSCKFPFSAHQGLEEIMQFICNCIDTVRSPIFEGIAIGVPCIVNNGTVFNAVNIPAWKNYDLQDALEQRFNVPVYINNDVNCFAQGAYLFRKNENITNMSAICLGTGIGAGFIIERKLYTGNNCSAGEIGSIEYLTGTFDDYCSGSFFSNHYGISGEALAEKARKGDQKAKDAFIVFGKNLAKAIIFLLLTVDTQLIVLGGSVAHSFDLFIDTVWDELTYCSNQNIITNLKIEKNTAKNCALIGAAFLFLAEKNRKIIAND